MNYVLRSCVQESTGIWAWSVTSCSRRCSGRPTQPAAVLQYLVRPRTSLRAGLAELQPRRVPCCRPRPVTHMMPGIRVVLIPVTPFPAAICPRELRTAERAGLLSGLGEYYGERIVCHLRNPLHRRWLCPWPSGPGIVAAAPSGMRSQDPAYAPPDVPPLQRRARKEPPPVRPRQR